MSNYLFFLPLIYVIEWLKPNNFFYNCSMLKWISLHDYLPELFFSFTWFFIVSTLPPLLPFWCWDGVIMTAKSFHFSLTPYIHDYFVSSILHFSTTPSISFLPSPLFSHFSSIHSKSGVIMILLITSFFFCSYSLLHPFYSLSLSLFPSLITSLFPYLTHSKAVSPWYHYITYSSSTPFSSYSP